MVRFYLPVFRVRDYMAARDSDSLRVMFENDIESMLQDGYDLHSWNMTETARPDGDGGTTTIVAVYKLREVPK